MILYFFLTAVCIAATIVCIVMETEWWVWVIFAGCALLCAAIAIAKLREELEYVRAARKPRAPKKAKYPKLVAHCLSLSKSELLTFAKKHYRIVSDYFKTVPTDNPQKYKLDTALGVLVSVLPADGEFSEAEKTFFAQFDNSVNPDLMSSEGAKELADLLWALMPELPKAVKQSVLSLSAALTVVGGVTPGKLAYFKKLLKNSKKERTQ